MANLQDGYFGNYRGVVKQHGANGYCKIFFPSIYPYEYIKDLSKLPWAEPAMPLVAGGALTNGTFQYPDINSVVWAFFEAGNINNPVFFAQTNNNKVTFVSGEVTITYNNLTIKLDSNNDTIEITNTMYDGNITLSADNINLNGDVLNINNKHTIQNTTYRNEINCPITKVNGSLGVSNGATGTTTNNDQFNEGICTKIG